MLFIFSTPVLIGNLWQLKTAVSLHWCLIRAACLFINDEEKSFVIDCLSLSPMNRLNKLGCLSPASKHERNSFFKISISLNLMPSCQKDPVAGSLNKRLILSSSFRCDQIYKYKIYNFGHTLLCYLSPT
jgi:hypothetical protein